MPVNLKKIDQKLQEDAQKEAQKNIGQIRNWKPVIGRNQIRLMPPAEGLEDYCKEVYTHWQVGNDKSPPFTCQVQTPGLSGGCPICDEVNRLRATNDPVDQDTANKMRAKREFVANIVDLNDPTFSQEDYDSLVSAGREATFDVGDTKIQVFRFGPMIYGQINNVFAALKKDLTDLTTGRDIVLNRTGKGKENTKYTATALDPTPFENVGAPVLSKLYNLDAITAPRIVSDMQAALSGAVPSRSLPPPTMQARPQVTATVTANLPPKQDAPVTDVEALMKQMQEMLAAQK